MNSKNRLPTTLTSEESLKGLQSVDMTLEVGASICIERTGEVLRLVKIEDDKITFEKID